jgi:dihydrofolate synthase / folylpolyglutamate synthase
VTYREALAWLYATQKFGIKLGLETTERLLRELRIEKHARVVHVAGTNGKGSVCAMVDSICRAADYRTGLFTSPHLISFRERIRVNGEMISEEEVALGLTKIRDLIADWNRCPTFFEIATALALHHFQEWRCEIIVLETGMGGRLDATNAITADVSVITPIDFDHQKWLGNSLAEIAREKAGIIKSGVAVISAAQHEQAANAIKQRAVECGSPVEIIQEPWTRSAVALRGTHQKINAALAVAAVRQLQVSDDVINCGLKTVQWPARFHVWNERIVVDGAHNPAGARTLVETWRAEFGDQYAAIILAVLRDKNMAEMINIFAAIATNFILPQIRSQRAVSPTELAGLISGITPPLRYSIADSTAEAIALAKKETSRALITGSLHFAGEALAILRGEPELLEECAQ